MSGKIYTKTGDKGMSSLVGGTRVSKTHRRLCAYGTLDEINSNIGLAISVSEKSQDEIVVILTRIQHQLFNLGSLVACEKKEFLDSMPQIRDKDIQWLELQMDHLQADLPELKNFIIPGGHSMTSQLHVVRTVTRRAERELVDLMDTEAELPEIWLQYLNRLSDLAFVMARKSQQLMGLTDVLWDANAAD